MSARRKIASDPSATSDSSDAPRSAQVDVHAVDSPARFMQRTLETRLNAQKRWRPLATAGFVLATCGGFWSAVVWGATRLLRP
jgi:hypothetical protein